MTAAPVVTSISFDKTSYVAGDEITATVNYVPGQSDNVQQFTGQAVDETTSQVGQLSVTFTVSVTDPTTVSASDDGSREWTPVSDDGSVAVFTAVA